MARPADLSVGAGALQGYYSRYGFNAVGDVYLEDDIPHIGMRRDLE